jgi:hypothetical protein
MIASGFSRNRYEEQDCIKQLGQLDESHGRSAFKQIRLLLAPSMGAPVITTTHGRQIATVMKGGSLGFPFFLRAGFVEKC